jgi:DNA-binding NarL/FixJ family response regulator
METEIRTSHIYAYIKVESWRQTQRGSAPVISTKVQTRRQRVLELITEGLSTREIAEELGITRATVRLDVQFLLVSHGADNQTHLSAIVVRRGIVK